MDKKYSKIGDGKRSPAKKKIGPRFTKYARLNDLRTQIYMKIEKDVEFDGRSL